MDVSSTLNGSCLCRPHGRRVPTKHVQCHSTGKWISPENLAHKRYNLLMIAYLFTIIFELGEFTASDQRRSAQLRKVASPSSYNEK